MKRRIAVPRPNVTPNKDESHGYRFRDRGRRRMVQPEIALLGYGF